MPNSPLPLHRYAAAQEVVGRLDERLKELNAALKALKDQEKAVRTEVVPVLKEGKGAEAALEAAVKAAEAAVRGLLLAWA